MTNTMRGLNKLSSPQISRKTGLQSSSVTPPGTPTTLSVSAHQLLAEIQDIYNKISLLPDLAPGQTVNTLLTRLVNLSIAPYSPEFTSYFFSIPSVVALCSQLRPLCSIAEGELEKYWAHRMLQDASSDSSNNTGALSLFPYYQNYIDLSRLEYVTVSAYLPSPPKNIAFIGSGPLPLTSLCMLDQSPSSTILNIDRDAGALRVSEDLCQKLGYAERMKFVCEDVDHPSKINWTDFDVVFLAALVGEDTCSKLRILGELSEKLRVGTLVVVRSAKGLREVLYPVLELSGDLEKIGMEVLVEVHPWTKVVNSVVVLRVMEKDVL